MARLLHSPDDLERYLRHEPISARPDSVTYRAGRFVRRNRLAVTLTSTAVIAILAGAAGTWIQSRTARKQRDAALHQLAGAERLNDFNQFLMTDARASNAPLTANELLDRAEQIVEHENYSDDPADHVELLISLAEQYGNRGKNANQLRLLQEAYGISHGLEDPAARAKAACALGDALMDETGTQGPRAESLIQEGMNDLRDDPQFGLERVFCLWKGSDVAWQNGNVGEALARDQAAQKELNASKFQSKYLKLRVLMESATAYSDSQLDQAIAGYKEAITLEQQLGYGQTRTAGNTSSTLAWVLMRAGRPFEAQQYYRRGMDVFGEDVLGSWVLQAYAEALRELGRLKEAVSYAERSYQKSQRSGNYISRIQSMTELLRIFRDQGDYRRAQKMLAELNPIMRRELAPGHFWFATIAAERSLMARAQKQWPQALALADRAVALDQTAVQSGAEGAAFLPVFLYQRADIEVDVGQPEKAKADVERALSL